MLRRSFDFLSKKYTLKIFKNLFISISLLISSVAQGKTSIVLECQVSGRHLPYRNNEVKIQEQRITVSVTTEGENQQVKIEGRGYLNFGSIKDRSIFTDQELIMVSESREINHIQQIHTVTINRVTGFIDATGISSLNKNIETTTFSGYCRKIDSKPKF